MSVGTMTVNTSSLLGSKRDTVSKWKPFIRARLVKPRRVFLTVLEGALRAPCTLLLCTRGRRLEKVSGVRVSEPRRRFKDIDPFESGWEVSLAPKYAQEGERTVTEVPARALWALVLQTRTHQESPMVRISQLKRVKNDS